jgi:isocitrate/isopropylmalate dehydrogenase
MRNIKLKLIPGDGIGIEVIREGKKNYYSRWKIYTAESNFNWMSSTGGANII